MINFCRIYDCGYCTSGYIVSLDKEYTVAEFIDYIFKERNGEWGSIDIVNHYSRSYKNSKFSYNGFEEDVLNKKIKKVTAHGGWTLMDYNIYVEEDPDASRNGLQLL